MSSSKEKKNRKKEKRLKRKESQEKHYWEELKKGSMMNGIIEDSTGLFSIKYSKIAVENIIKILIRAVSPVIISGMIADLSFVDHPLLNLQEDCKYFYYKFLENREYIRDLLIYSPEEIYDIKGLEYCCLEGIYKEYILRDKISPDICQISLNMIHYLCTLLKES